MAEENPLTAVARIHKKLEREIKSARNVLHLLDLSCQGAEDALAKAEGYCKERNIVPEHKVVSDFRALIERARQVSPGKRQ